MPAPREICDLPCLLGDGKTICHPPFCPPCRAAATPGQAKTATCFNEIAPGQCSFKDWAFCGSTTDSTTVPTVTAAPNRAPSPSATTTYNPTSSSIVVTTSDEGDKPSSASGKDIFKPTAYEATGDSVSKGGASGRIDAASDRNANPVPSPAGTSLFSSPEAIAISALGVLGVLGLIVAILVVYRRRRREDAFPGSYEVSVLARDASHYTNIDKSNRMPLTAGEPSPTPISHIPISPETAMLANYPFSRQSISHHSKSITRSGQRESGQNQQQLCHLQSQELEKYPQLNSNQIQMTLEERIQQLRQGRSNSILSIEVDEEVDLDGTETSRGGSLRDTFEL